METRVKGEELIDLYLKKLTLEIGEQNVGSNGNNEAVDYFFSIMKSLGYDMKKDGFYCIEWEYGEVYLRAGEKEYETLVSPYSLPCDVNAELVVVSTLE